MFLHHLTDGVKQAGMDKRENEKMHVKVSRKSKKWNYEKFYLSRDVEFPSSSK